MTALLRSSCLATESRRSGSETDAALDGVSLSELIPVTSAMGQSLRRRNFLRFDLKIDDIGLVELNEAFAAQAIGCMRQLGPATTTPTLMAGPLPWPPTGCSGARILVTLMHEMKYVPRTCQGPFMAKPLASGSVWVSRRS